LTEPEIALNRIYGNNLVNDQILENRINDFKNIALNKGFNVICSKSDSIGSIAILFRKIVSNNLIKPEEIQIIPIVSNYEKWINILKNKINENIENDRKEDNVWLIANDSSINGIIGLVNCLRLEPGGEKIRCILDYDKQFENNINFSEKPFSDILINDLPINVIKEGKIGTYRHLSLAKNYDQIETHDYFLNCGQTGDISGIQWFDSKNIASNERYISFDNTEYNQIRCNIYSSGVNFRDVMVATGIHISYNFHIYNTQNSIIF
jgi:fatty acid synthase